MGGNVGSLRYNPRICQASLRNIAVGVVVIWADI